MAIDMRHICSHRFRGSRGGAAVAKDAGRQCTCLKEQHWRKLGSTCGCNRYGIPWPRPARQRIYLITSG